MVNLSRAAIERIYAEPFSNTALQHVELLCTLVEGCCDALATWKSLPARNMIETIEIAQRCCAEYRIVHSIVCRDELEIIRVYARLIALRSEWIKLLIIVKFLMTD
uniref:Uncharacterized protein n=1 Tax=Anopheles coluzzii TaxID=1518534 RepID=A0A8W7PGB2_ANOCL